MTQIKYLKNNQIFIWKNSEWKIIGRNFLAEEVSDNVEIGIFEVKIKNSEGLELTIPENTMVQPIGIESNMMDSGKVEEIKAINRDTYNKYFGKLKFR